MRERSGASARRVESAVTLPASSRIISADGATPSRRRSTSRPDHHAVHIGTPRSAGSARGEREQRGLAAQRLAGGAVDLYGDGLAGRGESGEVHHLVVARAATQAARVGARRAFDEHVECAPDETLGAFARAALDDLDEALETLHLELVGQL